MRFSIHAVLQARLAACSLSAPLHTSVIKLAAAGAARLAYAVRPLALEGCDAGPCGDYGRGGPLQLAGYGVELALKNMEYKAMDEKARPYMRLQ